MADAGGHQPLKVSISGVTAVAYLAG